MQEQLSDDDLTTYRPAPRFKPPAAKQPLSDPQPLWVWLFLTYACAVSTALTLIWIIGL